MCSSDLAELGEISSTSKRAPQEQLWGKLMVETQESGVRSQESGNKGQLVAIREGTYELSAYTHPSDCCPLTADS